jgi:hypothetical protein
MERKKQQADLLIKLGLVLAPLYEIINEREAYDALARSRAGAKFFADFPKFQQEVRDFPRSEAGHIYRREYTRINSATHDLERMVEQCLDDPETLTKVVEEKKAEIQDALLAIPVLPDSIILDAHTPFSTYCLMKDLCQTIGNRLILVDRYLGGTVFYRYLRAVPKGVKVTLVTWPETEYKPTKWAELIDVSKLYASEYGSANYRLLVNKNIHDRWLYLDEQMYSLGGSIKDAGHGNNFTLTKIAPNADNHQKIEQLLNAGTEIFGPAQPIHP